MALYKRKRHCKWGISYAVRITETTYEIYDSLTQDHYRLVVESVSIPGAYQKAMAQLAEIYEPIGAEYEIIDIGIIDEPLQEVQKQ